MFFTCFEIIENAYKKIREKLESYFNEDYCSNFLDDIIDEITFGQELIYEILEKEFDCDIDYYGLKKIKKVALEDKKDISLTRDCIYLFYMNMAGLNDQINPFYQPLNIIMNEALQDCLIGYYNIPYLKDEKCPVSLSQILMNNYYTYRPLKSKESFFKELDEILIRRDNNE